METIASNPQQISKSSVQPVPSVPAVPPVQVIPDPALTNKPKLSLLLVILFLIAALMLIMISGLVFLFFTNRLILVPINGADKHIYRAGVMYSYKTQITQVRQDSKGIILDTSPKIFGEPEIIVQDSTKLYDSSGQIIQEITPDVFQPGQSILVTLTYAIPRKKWETSRVDLR